ncbi:HutD family protein, partial [Escherichia coli]|uniref:HutD family protein n=1 Tax=Escherichia coli TaxID=562 RepID=UPI00278C412B
ADLNIMTDRARARHTFTLLAASTGQSHTTEAATVIVHALAEATVAALESGERVALNPGDTLVIEQGTDATLTVTLTSDAAAAQVGVVEIRMN